MEKRKYVVTESAGRRVAGRRVKPGMTLDLTETEARYELLNGAIEPASKPAQKAKPKTVTTAEAG